MKGKVFIVVNEPSSDRDDHSAKLKNLITGKEITINNKYGMQYSVKNYVNYVFTSNKPYITHMGNSSRREAIYKCPTFEQMDILRRVSALMKWARSNKGRGFSHVLNWYMERDIADFDPYAPAPMTEYKQVAIQLSKTPIEAFCQELAEWTEQRLGGVGAFTAPQLAVLCERWGHDARPKVQYIKKALQPFGDVEPARPITVGGKTSRYTILRITKIKAPGKMHGDWAETARDTEREIQRELGTEGSF
jgi:hypothetical protein